MIGHLDIHFVHAKNDEKLQKYIEKKLGRLDHYIPKNNRANAYIEVTLKEGKLGKVHAGPNCCVEVTLHMPPDSINVSETSLNMYTAVDIVELKLRQQIKKHKEQHYGGSLKRRLAMRLAR